MINNPLVSILMANYNNGKFISTAINSVILQTYSPVELIIVDDASIENTKSLISDYLSLYSQTVFFYENKKNLGCGATLAECVKYAKGDYLAILDPDDCIESDAIEIMMRLFNQNPDASLCYSNMYMCDKDLNVLEINKFVGKIPEGQTYQSISPNFNSHIMHFRVISRKAYYQTSGFDRSFKKAIDKDIIYKLEEVGKVVFIDTPLYCYRQHEGSISLFKNKWKARLWEVRAKELARKRRIKTSIPTLTKTQINAEYAMVYKNLCFQSLQEKKYWDYCVFVFYLFKLNFSFYTTLLFIYYSFKKNNRPDLFQ
jgi:glycosyltransferase involved in cell wall biosynthesis